MQPSFDKRCKKSSYNRKVRTPCEASMNLQGTTPGPLIVATDLDGTLLDHYTYDWQPAARAIELLKQKCIPLVINTSKTADSGYRPPMKSYCSSVSWTSKTLLSSKTARRSISTVGMNVSTCPGMSTMTAVTGSKYWAANGNPSLPRSPASKGIAAGGSICSAISTAMNWQR